MTITAEQAELLLDTGSANYCGNDLARALVASEAARKLAEERLAKAVEGLNDQALFLEQSHAVRMASIGRDPAKYASDLSMMAQRVRAILKEIDNG